MPTVEHKDQPSIPAAAPHPVPQVSQTAAQELQTKAAAIASVVSNPTIKTEDLEAAVRAVLTKQHNDAVDAAKPKEPDWASLTEQKAMQQDTYIPVIDHEVADYMNVRLKDPEYEAVWVHHSPRRLGQKQAEGYTLITQTDIDPNFTLPMAFDSEGVYRYEDCIAMKVHKRILYGKRKKALQVSLNQLTNRNRPPRVRMTGTYDQAAAVPETLSYGTLYSDIV